MNMLRRLLVILSMMVMVACFLAMVLVLAWFFPLPSLTDLHVRYWSFTPVSEMPLQQFVWLWVRYALFMLAHYWLLWLVPVGGMMAGWIVMMGVKSEGEEMLLARLYTQDQQLNMLQQQNKEQDLQLNRGQTTLDALYQQASEAYAALDGNGRVLRCNVAFLDMMRRLGTATEDLVGRSLPDLWPGVVNTSFFTAIQNKKPWFEAVLPVESPAMHLQARMFWNGEGMVVLLQDVSFQFSAQANQSSFEALTRQLVEESVRPISILDPEGRYVMVSRKWNATLGLDPMMRLIGQPHASVAPGFPANFGVILHQLEAGQVVAREDERFVMQGEERVLGWHIRQWRNAFGQPGGYLFAVYDNTELTRLRAQLKDASDREHALAYTDMLTGLPNRALLQDRLAMALAQAHRQLGRIVVMFLDLDGFKKVNDTLGHEAGDLLLKQVAHRLKKLIRDTDTVARLGGDEFVIVLAVRNREDADVVAGKVLAAIREPFDVGGVPALVGTSIGMAMYPLDSQEPDALVKFADAAMYAAKQAGKNTWRWYEKPKET